MYQSQNDDSWTKANLMDKIPEQGDLIWIDTEPHVGIEEGGFDTRKGNIRRSMVVISRDDDNK